VIGEKILQRAGKLRGWRFSGDWGHGVDDAARGATPSTNLLPAPTLS
jgi:hypothetical protein